MSVTLQWLLGRGFLALDYLEGPDPSTVEVRWAHSVELTDPSPWLAGGELVLTTGLHLPRSVAGRTDYVRRLAGAGAAALGFGVGLEYDEVPAAVRSACRDTGLPLLVVPLPTPFIAVIRAIADHEAEQQRAGLQDAVDFQHHLTRTALEHGAPGLVEALGRRLGAAVVALDRHRAHVASTGADAGLVARVHQETADDAAAAARTLPLGEDTALMLLRLVDGRRTCGWLAIRTEGEPPRSHQRLLIGQVASMLTLQLGRSADIGSLYADLAGAAADAALAGVVAEPSPLRRFGLGGPEGVRVLAVGSHRDRVVTSAELADVLEGMGRPHVTTTRGRRAVAVLPGDLADADLVAIRRGFSAGGRLDVVIGASTSQPLARAASGLAEAERAVATAAATNRPVVSYGNLELDALLDDTAFLDRVVELTGGGLADLLDSDRAADRELLRTLRAYLEANGSWEAASRGLGVHRHTVRQRLARVNELTGLDLDSAQTRAATLLALLGHDRSGRARPDG